MRMDNICKIVKVEVPLSALYQHAFVSVKYQYGNGNWIDN